MAKKQRKQASLSWNDKKIQKFLRKITKQSIFVEKKRKQYVDQVLSPIIFADVMNHFAEQQGSPSKLWDEWSDSYLKKLKRMGRQGNQILAFTGRLRQNFKPGDWRVDAKGIVWFNDAKTAKGFPYAAHHDEGKSSYRGNPRRFMWTSAKAKRLMAKGTLAFMLGKK